MTMSLVQTVTVGAGGAADITFSNIPQDATDLYLVFSVRESGSYENGYLQINDDTTTVNYFNRYLIGTGAAASSSNNNDFAGIFTWGVNRSTYTANTFGNGYFYIPNYTSSTSKSISTDGVSENNASTAYQSINAGRWTGTSAITKLVLKPFGGFVQHSTASLYKITKA